MILLIKTSNTHEYIGCYSASSVFNSARIECDSDNCPETCNTRCTGYPYFGIKLNLIRLIVIVQMKLIINLDII